MSGTQPPVPAVAAGQLDSLLAVDDPIEHIIHSKQAPKRGLGRWRRPVGLLLLLATVFLWTASNFLQSTIFADNTYSKPFFVTYVNSAIFVVPLAPMLVWRACRYPGGIRQWWRSSARGQYAPVKRDETETSAYRDDPGNGRLGPALNASEELLLGGQADCGRLLDSKATSANTDEEFTVSETAQLAIQFSLIWFLSNYSVAACLEYTTVASSTIINNTSSVFTLIFGTMLGVERFTIRKLLAIMASIAGIVLICSVDLLATDTDEHRGDFPTKTPGEMAIGDVLAFASAIMYGFYAVFMKKSVDSESRVNMPIFFGFVGLFNILCLWPLFFVLHYTGIERFHLPPTQRVTTIILSNSAASLISDFFWAYAVLLTSPIIVTVGLSMTIPLSLIGQIVLNSQTAPGLYWVGACVMLVSFIFVNMEETKGNEDLSLLGDPENPVVDDEHRRQERRLS